MHLSEYVVLAVPQGPVVLTATLPYMGDVIPPTPSAPWASLPSCAGFARLDWRRWAEALPTDIPPCYSELTKLYAECRITVTYLPGLKTTHIPACNYKLNGIGDAFFLLHLAPFLLGAVDRAPEGETSPSVFHPNGPFQAQLRLDAETGKTYYVKYSFDASFSAHTHLVLMDAARGAKEIRSLHPAHLAGN